MPLKIVFSMILVSLLVAGCGASRHLLVEKTELDRFEFRLQEQGQHLRLLDSTQDEILVSLLESHDQVMEQLEVIAGRQESMWQWQQEWEEFNHDRWRQFRSARQAVQDAASSGTQGAAVVRLPEDKQLVGEVEKVFLSPPGMIFSARIDTGATTSSLDAHEIERFERDGDRWVRFTLINPEDEGQVTLERRIIRHARIIQAVADEAERRPVVEIEVTVGDITQIAEFTLSDRRHLQHPALIGRNILLDIMIVDVGQRNIAPPRVPANLDGLSDDEVIP